MRLEKVHGFFGIDWAEDSVESVEIDQLPVVIANRLEQVLQLRRLEEQVADLADRLEGLEAMGSASSKVATIQTFEPEPYELLKPIGVTIAPDSAGGFVASFFDANVSTTGDNEQEAFGDLKNLILDTLESLSREAPERLGPEPLRQLAVLRSFIRGR
jgi:hypothetical protein